MRRSRGLLPQVLFTAASVLHRASACEFEFWLQRRGACSCELVTQ